MLPGCWISTKFLLVCPWHVYFIPGEFSDYSMSFLLISSLLIFQFVSVFFTVIISYWKGSSKEDVPYYKVKPRGLWEIRADLMLQHYS